MKLMVVVTTEYVLSIMGGTFHICNSYSDPLLQVFHPHFRYEGDWLMEVSFSHVSQLASEVLGF